MQIARVTPQEHSEFLNLVNAEIRPGRAKTNAWDDFPLILAPENLDWMLAVRDDQGRIAAGIACLIREIKTSCGNLGVAGIGSVVTRPDCQGRGFSSALQNEMLSLLRRNNVPLGVLWTDQPEIYAGRGFIAAGWEVHVDIAETDLATGLDPAAEIRNFHTGDTPAVEVLYSQHSLRTVRLPGDSELLYNMPGTTGLVLVGPNNVPLASVFCGKGADFPDYVAEWSGPDEMILLLLNRARELELAHHVLVPADSESLVNLLVDRGASWFAQPSGQWVVLDPAALKTFCNSSGTTPAAHVNDPREWLGTVDGQGNPQPGPLGIAIWGFDSV
ncbi:MAG: GNAT family N-acetyltransferase [Gemmatimonadales bacterium]|nr:GNAT family N-acetyltransferase [Gemmatimonadales bacterium]